MHALRALWSMDIPTYEGRFVKFRETFMRPKPVNGTVPIVIGGHSKAAASRAGRLADGFFPARGASPELLAVVRGAAESAGRDPKSVEITASIPDDPAEIPALAALGISRVLVPVTSVAGLKRSARGIDGVLSWKDTIARYAAS
jgi:alkanesulfonate monooxygenase SsuD/methylene tetrahydromethanopterin reductase-like flavin-dependent oxidoreductase (luciferase family)